MNKVKGFTLIELLISVSLLSALLLLGNYSYSLFATKWRKDLGTFNETIQALKGKELLNKLLSGTVPYVILDDSQSNSNLKATFLFVGNTQSIFAVSNVGIVSEHHPEVYKIYTKESSDGKLDLIYQSSSLSNIHMVNVNQSFTFEHEFILLNDIDSLNIQYYGWDNIDEKITKNSNKAVKKWYSDYSGVDRRLLPEKISLEISINDKLHIYNFEVDKESDLTLFRYDEDA